VELIQIDIPSLRAGMRIIVDENPRGKPKLSKHVVSHTSLAHPGEKSVYCKHGFVFQGNSKIYLNDSINKTIILLEDKMNIKVYSE